MTVPVQHSIITGAYLPILKEEVDLRETNILFHDYYPELFEPLGIKRDEMMIVMPQVMTVDILSGLDKLHYVDEEPDDKSAQK